MRFKIPFEIDKKLLSIWINDLCYIKDPDWHCWLSEFITGHGGAAPYFNSYSQLMSVDFDTEEEFLAFIMSIGS
jgi:hypothetical protein